MGSLFPSFLRPRVIYVKEQNQILLAELTPYFTSEGFTLKPDYLQMYDHPITFEKQVPQGWVWIDIQVAHIWTHHFSQMRISIKQVEDILLDTGIPNMDLSIYRSGQHHLRTVSDVRENVFNYDVHKRTCNTVKETKRYARAVIEYMQMHGPAFVTQFLDYQNIIAEMNRLEQNGIKWFKGILGGGPESFTRGLIISKLCNDPDYPRKVQMVHDLFYKQGNNKEHLQVHFEKVMARLNQL